MKTLYHDESDLSCPACKAPISREVDPETGNESLSWACGCKGARPEDANPKPQEPEPVRGAAETEASL